MTKDAASKGVESTDNLGIARSEKDQYLTLQQTRNFEISLFWQRSNYFLGLSSALALGFFNLREHRQFAIGFATLGTAASILWVSVCLGGKYWQTRWEQRLRDFEIEKAPDIALFGASRERTDDDVRRGLEGRSGLQRIIYEELVQGKPSVSYSMILLAIMFTLAWAVVLSLSIVTGF
jgi:hypothetical protein